MLDLKKLAQAIKAEYLGNQDIKVSGVSTDTRNIQAGELFIALRAQRDGHDFIEDAIKKGATAIMVDHKININIPQIIVTDTLKGLGQLARAWRRQFNIPIIALTGSCGKTTTKEMIASILRERGSTLATEVNLNNAIGVPLTLLKLRPEHRYAVIEMGTNAPGEIAYSASIAEPSVALITNILEHHLDKLKSIDNISNEKSDIFSYLNHEGIAIINLNEPFAQSWKNKINTEHRVTFGLKTDANVYAEHNHCDLEHCEFDIVTPIGKQAVYIPQGGKHLTINALAATACTLAVGATLENIAQGFAKLKAVAGRFRRLQLATDTILIDDTQNASFKSIENGIDMLRDYHGKKIVILSNMAEMGTDANLYHEKLGQLLKNSNLDTIFLYGDKKLLAHTLKICTQAKYFDDKQELAKALLPLCQKDTLLLVKGSRGNKMEEINEILIRELGLK